MPVALIGGFVVDIFTLNRIDQIFDNGILITHLLIAGTSIALLFSETTKKGERILTGKRPQWLQTAMVFSFGALFSGFIIFYTRSGSLITSWPFILAMILLMLGTEFQKKYFYRLRLQIAVYTTAIIAWSIFFVPVVLRKFGPLIFVVSSLIAIIINAGFFFLLKNINPKKFNIHQKKIIMNALVIICGFNFLYFTNILPPIPLSLKYKAVYYEVNKTPTGYLGQYEKTAWYNFFQKRSRIIEWNPGEDIFVFTQVFAPAKLQTTILHTWQYYNEQNRKWETRDIIPITIEGGRSDGFRGYTKKQHLDYGSWRVKTKTKNGQILGIIKFAIKENYTQKRELITEEL